MPRPLTEEGLYWGLMVSEAYGLQSLKMNQRGGGRTGEALHLDLKVEGRIREWYQSFETPKAAPVTAMATALVLSPSFCSLVWIKTEFLQVAYLPTCL